MSLPKSCKKKSCYDSQYGCSKLNDCGIYQDMEADAMYDDWKDSDEARELFEELDQNK